MLIPNSTPIGIIFTWLLAEIKRYFDFAESQKNEQTIGSESEKLINEEKIKKTQELPTGSKTSNDQNESSDTESISSSKKKSKSTNHISALLVTGIILVLFAWICVNLFYYINNR